MSDRNSFVTEYIYNEDDSDLVYDALCKNFIVSVPMNGIISGYVKNPVPCHTVFDISKYLNGVQTKNPVTFVCLCEGIYYPTVQIATLQDGEVKFKYEIYMDKNKVEENPCGGTIKIK